MSSSFHTQQALTKLVSSTDAVKQSETPNKPDMAPPKAVATPVNMALDQTTVARSLAKFVIVMKTPVGPLSANES